MFDRLPAQSLTEHLSDAVYRWSGVESWLEAEATVYSCEWIVDLENGGGWYRVDFSYHANGEYQSGSFNNDAPETSSPYLRGDTFTLRYNPKRPSRYYYPNERSQFWPLFAILSAILMGIAAAAIAISVKPK